MNLIEKKQTQKKKQFFSAYKQKICKLVKKVKNELKKI